jgi:RND superfamily putative drug exporter
MLARVAAPLADLALRRPWALLVGNLAVLVVAVALASGAPDRLGIGSLALSDGRAPPDLVVATTGEDPVRSRVYRVTLDVITSQIRSDPAVVSVRRGEVSRDSRSTSLIVALEGDEGERQRSAQRIEERIDPGPLRVAVGGEVATLLDARHSLSEDLWKLELLALPFVVLVLAGIFGLRLSAAPTICAATAIAGTLAALRIIGGLADVSLLAIAPAAAVGLALGVEAPRSMVARFRDEAALTTRDEALHRTVSAAWRSTLPLGLAAAVAAGGLLATPLDQAPSLVLGCALAAALALASALVCVPPILAVSGAGGTEEGRTHRPQLLAGWLAASRVRTVTAALLALVALLAAAAPTLDGESRPFAAQDLPAGTDARRAAQVSTTASLTRARERRAKSTPAKAAIRVGQPTSEQSLFEDMPVVAAVSAAALALVLVACFRSLRLVPLAVVALLPAAGATGLAVLVFQDGHLAGILGQDEQGALETGALATLLAALASIGAARTVGAVHAVRDKNAPGREPGWIANGAIGLVFAAAVAGTLIAGAASGVLAGSELYSAREFGLAVAAGLVLDLVLVRTPLLAALGRWGG